MSITAGVISLVSKASTEIVLSATAASGGTGPYTYQWYRDTVSGFTPGVGNLISGATSLDLDDSGLIPNTPYYYKLIAIDTGHSNDAVTYSQLAVSTLPASQNPNQFTETSFLGMLDQAFNYDTTAAEIDVSQVGSLYAGAPVKIVDSSDGVPKVVGCSADSDEVFGFINYDIKTQAYVAGSPCEISQDGNVMYLYATGPIARGAQVILDVANNGVKQATGSSGSRLVGYAFDKAAGLGSLFRVKFNVPSFLLDS